jgi:hypothetical protein
MAFDSDDILYTAEVEDKTQDFFKNFDKKLDELSAKASTSFSKVESGIKNAGKVAGVLGGVIGGITAQLSSMAVNKIFEAGEALKQFSYESQQLRARADTLAVSIELIGKNAGYSEEQLAGIEESMRETGISILATRQSMAQWIQANLDLGKATEVARVAQDAAVIAGVNSSEAFQRITHAAITLQPELLRSLNLVVNMQQEMEEYAKQTGKTVSQITVQEKQQIFLNAAIKAGVGVAGAYEAAMDTVGKKMGSLERVNEDLRIAFGAIFQPAMAKQIDATTKVLKDMTVYLEENEEELTKFGEIAAEVFGKAIELLFELSKQIIELPGKIQELSLSIAQLLGGLSDEEMEKRADGLGAAFRQMLTIIIASLATAVDTWTSSVAAMGDQFNAFKDLITGKSTFDEFRNDILASQLTLDKLKSTFNENFLEAAEFTGALQSAGDEADAADDAIGNLVGGMDDLADNTADAASAIEKITSDLSRFYDKMQQDIMERQLDAQRKAIEDALQESWRLEDIARRRAESIAQIMENANEAQRNAMQQHAEARIDIEREYGRRLRDIKMRFEYEAEELSRSRDAIGLLRLMRQNKQELKEAKQSRDDSYEDARLSYERQRKEIEKQRREQLKDLEKQLRKEEEEYQRSLERQRQLQELHDKWEEEDRQRKYAEELANMIDQFSKLEGATDEGLADLYSQWEYYFGDLIALATARQQQLSQLLQIPTAQSSANPYDYEGYVPATGSTMSNVIGQSGQVSHLLSSPSQLSPQMSVPRIEPVAPVKSYDKRQIDVNVRGEAMDPLIQRQLALALMEIERNRGVQTRYPV